MPIVKNIFSIDVEEIFHAEYVREYYASRKLTYRTPNILPQIISFLEKYNVKATFFIVGEILEKFPEIKDIILTYGHEIAFHGWTHKPLWKLGCKAFLDEVRRFKRIYPNVIGFRAPSFSLNNSTKWALYILEKEGFKYDSSVFPTYTPLYRAYNAKMIPYKPSKEDILREKSENCYNLMEFPLTIYKVGKLKIPIAGGFWLRLWDIRFIKYAIKKINAKGFPVILYIHTWELDPRIPKLKIPLLKHLITYYNIGETLKKIQSLFKHFKFISFEEFIST